MPIDSPRLLRRRKTLFAAPVIAAAILTACGGAEQVDAADPAAAAAVTNAAELAAQNLPNLQSAESAFDVEVLSVADGSVSTLRDAVTGDRPVLLWFYSPH